MEHIFSGTETFMLTDKSDEKNIYLSICGKGRKKREYKMNENTAAKNAPVK